MQGKVSSGITEWDSPGAKKRGFLPPKWFNPAYEQKRKIFWSGILSRNEDPLGRKSLHVLPLWGTGVRGTGALKKHYPVYFWRGESSQSM